MLISSSIWKPLRGPLKDWPLALCKRSSVDPGHDLELMDRVYPTNNEETVQVYHNEAQEWCFLSNQTPSEVLMFVGGDSDKGMAAGMMHHFAAVQSLT